MSSESSELSPKMFIEDPESHTKFNQKDYFILKREIIATISIILLILGIPLVVLSVNSFKERNVLYEKIEGLNETIQVNANEIKVLESLKTFYGFERIGKYGYFQKLEEKMTYEDGQKTCSKIFGHIIEFNETSEHFSGKVSALIKKFDLQTKYVGSVKFFVGLTDYEEEGVWKWASTERILNCTRQACNYCKASNCKPYPRGPWGKNEPNGKKKEDCAAIKVTKDWADQLEWEMVDVSCSEKSNIICQKSFHHTKLDIDDLPKN